MAKKKPVLLWRDGDRLGGRLPDGFQKMPNVVSERLIETLTGEGRTVLVLTWNPEGEYITVKRHVPEDDD